MRFLLVALVIGQGLGLGWGLGLGMASPSAFAADSSYVTYRIGKQSVRFFSRDADRLVINASCRDARGGFKCQAYSALFKASVSALTDDDHWGGSNPGAQICKHVGGEVTFAVDAQGNQNSFCRFPDQSIVDDGSLFFYGQINDAKRAK